MQGAFSTDGLTPPGWHPGAFPALQQNSAIPTREGSELLSSARASSSKESPRSTPRCFAPEWTAGNVCLIFQGFSDLRFGSEVVEIARILMGLSVSEYSAARGRTLVITPRVRCSGVTHFPDEGTGSLAEVTQLVT